MRISRRGFLDIILNLVWLFFGVILLKVSGNILKQNQKKSKKIIKNDLVNGVYFRDELIIYKNENLTRVFKSRCTHLGCKVRQAGDGNLVCPCHGSRFNYYGKVINGPANSPLEQVKFEIDKKKNELIIYD